MTALSNKCYSSLNFGKIKIGQNILFKVFIAILLFVLSFQVSIWPLRQPETNEDFNLKFGPSDFSIPHYRALRPLSGSCSIKLELLEASSHVWNTNKRNGLPKLCNCYTLPKQLACHSTSVTKGLTTLDWNIGSLMLVLLMTILNFHSISFTGFKASYQSSYSEVFPFDNLMQPKSLHSNFIQVCPVLFDNSLGKSNIFRLSSGGLQCNYPRIPESRICNLGFLPRFISPGLGSGIWETVIIGHLKILTGINDSTLSEPYIGTKIEVVDNIIIGHFYDKGLALNVLEVDGKHYRFLIKTIGSIGWADLAFCPFLVREAYFNYGYLGLKFIDISNLFNEVKAISIYFNYPFEKVHLIHFNSPFQIARLIKFKEIISISLYFACYELFKLLTNCRMYEEMFAKAALSAFYPLLTGMGVILFSKKFRCGTWKCSCVAINIMLTKFLNGMGVNFEAPSQLRFVFNLSFNDLISTPLQFLKCKYLVQLAFLQYAREYRRLNANAIIMTKALCHIRNIVRTHTWNFCNSLHLLRLMHDLWFNTYCNNFLYAIILRNKFKLERGHDIKIDERMGLNKCIINLEILYDNNFSCLLKWKYLLTNHDTYLINSGHSSIYHTRSQLKEGVYFSINTPIIVSAWSLKPIIVQCYFVRCSLLLFFIYGVYIFSLSVTQNLVTYFYRLKSQAAQLALNKSKVLVIYYYSILIVFFKHFDVEALVGFSLLDLALEWVGLGNLKIKSFTIYQGLNSLCHYYLCSLVLFLLNYFGKPI